MTAFTRRGTKPPDQDPETLYAVAAKVLDLTRAAAMTKGVILPDRQLVYLSPIPADCEQVAVMFSGYRPEPAPLGMSTCDSFRWVGMFGVAITRKTCAIYDETSNTPPPVEKMMEAAKIASNDLEVLLQLVKSLDEVGGDLQVLGGPPQGMLQSTQASFDLPVWGGIV